VHLRMEVDMYRRTYYNKLSVISAITDEWLTCTMGAVPAEVPVFGWPLGNELDAVFEGIIPDDDIERIKDLVFAHFDGNKEEPIFPIADIRIETSVGNTTVTVVGDVTRAGSMQQLRALAR
jgi:hypothetical protein